MLTNNAISHALTACFDASNPFARPLNIVELGLVEAITLRIDEDAPGHGIPGVPLRQALDLRLLKPSDNHDALAMLQAQIENRLAGLPELSRWEVRFVDLPLWSSERLAPDLRRTLAPDPPAFPILNNRLR